MKKGFTLIELLAVIVILAIIALIVTPVVSNIVANARISANARSVEGHIRNIELAIISKAFQANSTGDMDSYDAITSGDAIEGALSRPGNDIVTCESYTIKHGTVLEASGCTDQAGKWAKEYNYTNTEGAVVAESGSGDQGGEEPATTTWDEYCSWTSDEGYICDDDTEYDASWDIWAQANSSTGATQACAKFSGGSACMAPINTDDYDMYELETPIRSEFESKGATCVLGNSSLIVCSEGNLECFISEDYGFAECTDNETYRYCTATIDGGASCNAP